MADKKVLKEEELKAASGGDKFGKTSRITVQCPKCNQTFEADAGTWGMDLNVLCPRCNQISFVGDFHYC